MLLKIWNWDCHKEYKYMLVCQTTTPKSWTSDHFFESWSFETKAEALKYLKNDISKNDQGLWKLFEKVSKR